ncbi:glycosyltransferase [Candidatus Micrarchaeota archaeon]|nr:glycosyltransferase [Candidatus Micrarchaeota archaeon]
MMELIEVMGNHRVYDSMRHVLSLLNFPKKPRMVSIHPDYSNSRIFTVSQNNYVHYTGIPLKKENFYALRSPLISIGTWEALVRGVPFCIIEEYHRRKNYKNFIARILLRPFCGHPVLSSTKQTCSFLREFGINPILVPPALEKGKGAQAGKRKHILFVGKLLPSKNPQLFLELARSFPKEQFVMIGKGPLFAQMEKEAKKIANIKLIERVDSREELFGCYENAKLLLHPATQDPIGFVAIEALSRQTPVIASKNAGASCFLPREWVAEAGNKAEWEEKMRKILGNAEESVKLAEKTFEREHLDIKDEYFEKAAKELSLAVKERWPALFND